MTTPIWLQTLMSSANQGTRVFTSMKIHRLLLHFFVMTAVLLVTQGADAQPRRSRMTCSPVTPDMKVPFIEVSQLPDISRDVAYFEACSDLDNAWTPQSYPDPKYVPKRTLEHEARVNLLLQGLKDYVAAESDDWVSYINAWLGSSLPPPNVERGKFPDGESTSSISNAGASSLTKFKTTSKAISATSWQHVSPEGAMVYRKQTLSIRGLGTENLCITSVDLQKAFEGQSGYLLRPMSVRESQTRPNSEELAKLGGQWFGYEVYAFFDPNTKQELGLMEFGFGFKPCAASISVKVTKKTFQGDKQ